MPGIKPGPLGWQTSALTTELQEVRLNQPKLYQKILQKMLIWNKIKKVQKIILIKQHFIYSNLVFSMPHKHTQNSIQINIYTMI